MLVRPHEFFLSQMSTASILRHVHQGILAALVAAQPVAAVDSAWNVDADGDWATAGSWSAGVPGDTIGLATTTTDIATFSRSLTADRIVTVDTLRSIAGITFSNTSAYKYTLSGGSLVLKNGGAIRTAAGNGSHADTVSQTIYIQGNSGAASFTAGATSATSVLNIGGDVWGVSGAGGVTTLTLDGSNTGANTITGVLRNGNGGGKLEIIKDGAGTWTLAANNVYSGGTTVNAGSLVIDGDGTFGATSGALTADGATAIVNLNSTSQSVGVVSLFNGARINTGVLTSTVTGTAFNVESGSISSILAGVGALEKTTDDTVTLTGANIYRGGTTISAGSLVVTGAGTFGYYTGALTVEGATAIANIGTTNQTVGLVSLKDGAQIIGTTGTLNGSTFYVESGLISANLVGTGPLSKGTTGTVTVTGNNTYSGSTTVSVGTLHFTKVAALPGQTIFNKITVRTGATLAINVGSTGYFAEADITNILQNTNFFDKSILSLDTTNAGTFTYAPVIADRVALNKVGLSKIGVGTLTLTGANTYGGGTTVSAGTLALSGSGTLGKTNGALKVEGETTILDLGSTMQTVGAVSLLSGAQIKTGTLTSTAAGTAFSVESGSISSILAGIGALVKTTDGTVTLTGANTYSGGTTISAGTLTVAGVGTLGSTAGTLTVDGSTAILAMGTTNQTVGTVNLRNGAQVTGTSTLTASALNVENGLIDVNLAGTAILTKTTAGTVVLSGTNTYSGGTRINLGTLHVTKLAALPGQTTSNLIRLTAAGAMLEVSVGGSGYFTEANIINILNYASFATNSILGIDTTNASNGTFTYNPAIVEPIGLSKFGVGSLVLAGPNTYSGGTTVSAGTLAIEGAGTLGATTGALKVDGATTILDLGATSQTVGAVSLLNGALIKNGTLTSTAGATAFKVESGAISANLAGTGAYLTKDTSGKVTLTGNNTYTGGVKLNSGVLALGSSGALGTTGSIWFGDGSGNLGGTLQFSASNNTDYSNRFNRTVADQNYSLDTNGQDVTLASNLISPGGTLTKLGAGTLTLSGSNTYTGGTTVSGGTLWITKANSLPSYTSRAGLISVETATTLAINAGGTGEFTAGNILSLLTNATFAAGSTLAIDTTNAPVAGLTYSSPITNTMALRKLGAGSLFLTGTNTYDGGTTVSGGTLSFSKLADTTGASSLGNIGTILVSNSTFEYTGTTTVSTARFSNGSTGPLTGTTTISVTQSTGSLKLDGGYADTQDLIKTGAGTLILSGTNAVGFNSAAVNGGTLVLAMNSSNPSLYNAVGGISDVQAGATLKFAAAADGAFHNGQLFAVANDPVRQLHMTGGTLDLNGDAVNFIPVVDGSGIITNGATGTNAVLNVLLNNNKTFSGNIVDGLGTLAVRISNTAHSGTAPSGMIWTLSGNNTYSGGTKVTMNTLLASTPYSLGSNYATAGKVEIDGGATIVVQTGDGLTGWDATQLANLRAAAIFGVNAGFGIDTTNNDFNYNSTMAGTLKLVKLGINTLTLSVANTHTGGTVIGSPNQADAGTLLLSGAGTIGPATGGAVTVYGGTLDLGGTTQTVSSLKLGEGAAASTAVVVIGTGELKLGGDVTYSAINNPNGAIISGSSTGKLSLQATRIFTVGDSTAAINDLTVSANIQNGTGTGALTKIGTGTLLLTGTNTYTGVTSVREGILQASKTVSLPGQTTAGKISVSSGATLAINVGGTGEFSTTDITNLLTNGSFTGTSILGIDTSNAPGGTFTAPNLTGTRGLTKLGAGTLLLAGTGNTYTGATLVSAGTIQVSGTLASGGLVTVPTTGTLDVVTGGSIARDVILSGGLLNLSGSLGPATTLTLDSGTVNVLSATAAAGIVVLPVPGATPVLSAPPGQELGIAGKLTQTLSDGSFTISASNPTTPFRVGGANIVNHIDKLILKGNTTKIERLIGGMSAGLDVRGWWNLNGVLEGTNFDMPGTPTHSTYAGSIGYATGAIHLGGTDHEHFASTDSGNSGVLTGLMPTGYVNNYTVEYRGKLRITTAGNYTFSTTSDDGSALWIDPSSTNPPYSEAIVQNGGDHGMAQANSAPKTLTVGYHDIIVRFYENGGQNGLYVQWDPAGGNSFVDIPGANFFRGSQVTTPISMPTTDVAVTATSVLDLSVTGAATLGNLSLAAASGTLSFQNASSVSFDTVAATESSTVAAGISMVLRSGNVTVADTKSLTLNQVIADATAPVAATTLNKLGGGTLTLNGVNTYTGDTNVTAGKLSIGSAGRINSTSAVMIGTGEFNYNSTTALSKGVSFNATGGILSGTGTITQAVTVPNSNTLAPGNTIGTISFGGGLVLAGTYAAQMGTPSATLATPASGVSDRTVVTGDLSLTGSTLALSDNAGANSQGAFGVGAYRLITFTGTRSGTFASVTNALGSTLHEIVVYNGTSNGSVDLNVYRMAAANTIATPINLGNLRAGAAFGTSALTIQNTAATGGFSEGLNASGGATTGVASVSGSVINLAAGATNNTSLLVGLGGSANTATAGLKTGTVTINLASNGTGTSGAGDTPIPGQTITVNGTVYDLANAKYAGTTLAFGNVHKGTTVANKTVAFGNKVVTAATYQDSLNVAATTGNAKVTATGFTSLAATTDGLTTNNLSFAVNAATVGSLASTASLTLTSNANSVAGLTNGTATVVGSPGAITTTGLVYSGLMAWTGATGGSWNTGANWNDSQDVTIHAAPGLDAGFSGVDTATFGNATGNVTVNLDGAAPSLNTLTFNSTGSYTLAQGSGSTAITLAGTAPAITAAGTHAINVPLSLAGNVVITATGAGDSLTISGAMSGSGKSLTKNGAGTLTLNGTNTYSGATTVTAGKLSIGAAGTLNSTSAVTIGAGVFNYNSATAMTQGVSFSGTGGTLSGTGVITPAVTVSLNNILAPGNSVGTLGFGTGLTLAGTYAAQLGTPGATPGIGVSDRAAVTGNLTLTGGTLLLSDNAGAGSQGAFGAGAYRLLTFTGTRTGTFATVTNPLSATLHESVIYNAASNGSVDLNVYRLAAALAPSASVNLGNVRVGSSLLGSATVSNMASGDGFSELLKATVTGDGSGFSAVAGGASGTINYSKATTAAGAQNGSATVVLKSTGAGAYADTTLSTTIVALTGAAYDFANAKYTGATLAFGNVHKGATVASQTVGFGNQVVTAASYQDLLNVTATTGNAKVTATGFTGLAASVNGSTTNSLSFAVNAATVGSLASTASLTLTSNANNVAGLSNGTATVVGAPAAITTTGLVYSGLMAWTGATGGNWITGANWNDSQDAAIHAAPGLDAGFSGVDTATFGNATGSMTVNLDGAAPSVNALTFNATGSYTLAPGSGTSAITLAGTAPAITAAGTHTINVPLSLAGNTTVTPTNAGDSLTISGVISGSGMSLTKNGAGTLLLTRDNTYTGGTTVSNGTLLVNNSSGSGVGPGSLGIAAGATLGGTGIIGAATTLQGIHAPGSDSVGIQSFTNRLEYAATSNLQWQLTANDAGSRGFTFDGINITAGTFAITPGATLDLSFAGTVNFTNAFWGSNQAWTLVDLFSTVVGTGGSDVFALRNITGGGYSNTLGNFSVARVTDLSTNKNDVVLQWTTASVTSPYKTWIDGYTSIPVADRDPGDDPDQDGATNLAEFAFNGDPADSSDKGYVYGFTADSNGDSAPEFVLTIAVRDSTDAFSAANSPVANNPLDGITYTIEGSTTLDGFATKVNVVPTNIVPGWAPAAPGGGYQYRSFSLDGSNGLPGTGFLRVKVTKP
jgi:fibronectin-binding autotransporter adhesin